MDIASKILNLKGALKIEKESHAPNQILVDQLTKEIEQLEATQISFTVSARTARLIGQENFANAEGAIIELVKNSYDAEASICIIIIDQINDTIHILDDGDGMTGTIIKNQWMTIGTDDKKLNYKTKSRIKTGAKGIGRFALDRLGNTSHMVTKTSSTQSLTWDVNWNQFDATGAIISDIKATLLESTNSFFASLSSIQKSSGIDKSLSDFWGEEKGTLISIKGLRDVWDQKSVQSLFSNLEILVPPTDTNIFQIFLFDTRQPTAYGEIQPTVCEDYDYKLVTTVDENHDVLVKIYRNELSYIDLKKIGFFQKNTLNQSQYKEDIFEKGEFEIKTRLESLVAGFKDIDVNNNLSKIGAFTFSFYFMKRGGGQEREEEISRYPYKSVNYKTRTSWLDEFGGIKIFRDYFRVRPYGETKSSSFDWLDLGKRTLSNPTVTRPGYKVGPQQVYGIVNISRIGNINFEDKSSREGLQENDAFILFKEILKAIIGFFENDRNQIMMALKKIYDDRTRKDRVKKIADDKLKSRNNSSESEKLLLEAIEAYKEEIVDLIEEQKILRVLASAGLIVTSFAHEFKNHADSILPRTHELKDVLTQIIDDVKLQSLPTFFNPYRMLDDMRNQDMRLKSWLDFAILSVRKDKRTSKIINMINYIDSLERIWTPLLSRRNIKLQIHKGNFSEVRFKGHEIDLDGIFNNLIVNSVDAFKRDDSGTTREIKISFSVNFSDKVGISSVYEDTGPGLLEEIVDPNVIFQPFYTTKRDDTTGEKIGTGLGMWIVKSTIDEYDGAIEILTSKPSFKVKISLPHY